MDFNSAFESGFSYDEFLDKYGSEQEKSAWQGVYSRVTVSESQQQLLASFVRELRVLCMAGAWCGDCVSQCPIFRKIEEACPNIKLRFVDRDANPELAAELKICGGSRVPQVVFMSEDGKPIGRNGDRTLAKYRQMMGEVAGAVLPSPAENLLDAVTQDWLNEFERVQYILRLSPSLRQKHGD